MKNLKDAKTTIYPSTTRGGKELPSRSSLDSPFVLISLRHLNLLLLLILICRILLMMPLLLCMILMMKVLLCLILLCPLVNFLMNKLLGLEKKKLLKSEYDDDSDDENMPVIPEGYIFDMESSAAILACKDRYDLKRLLIKWNKESLRDKNEI